MILLRLAYWSQEVTLAFRDGSDRVRMAVALSQWEAARALASQMGLYKSD